MFRRLACAIFEAMSFLATWDTPVLVVAFDCVTFLVPFGAFAVVC
jgi:hypothetical protein